MSVDDPRSPIVIAAFAGWDDTGEAASAAVGHLESALDSRVIGKIEPDEYYNFQVNRPTGTGDYLVDLITEWPTTWYSAAAIPGTDIDVVLIRGPEPSIHWRAFTAEVVEFLRNIRTRIVITLGAFLADAPHTRPFRVTATAGDPQTAVRYDIEHSPSTDGPLGISTLFAQAVMNAGIDSVLLRAAVPHYVAQPPSPKATLALLNEINNMLGLEMPLGDIPESARMWERYVDELAAGDSTITDYVRSLEAAF